jgi:hypothetical protein
MTRKPNKDPVRALAKKMVGGNAAWEALSEGSKKFWLSEARLDIAALYHRGFQVVRRPPVEPISEAEDDSGNYALDVPRDDTLEIYRQAGDCVDIECIAA